MVLERKHTVEEEIKEAEEDEESNEKRKTHHERRKRERRCGIGSLSFLRESLWLPVCHYFFIPGCCGTG